MVKKTPEDDIVLPDFGFSNELTEVIKPTAKAAPTETFEMLTADEVAAVKAEFDKQQLEEKKKAARKKLMEKFLQEAREEAHSHEEMVEIEIVLPAHACTRQGYGDILIDGRPFFNGRRYPVRRSKAEGLREIMQSAWRHDEITNGQRNPNAYRSRRLDHIRQDGSVHANAGFVRF